MSQKEKKRMTGLRLAGEIRQYKKDALLSPLFTILCVILEILIPYKTAAIIDEGIAVGDMRRVAVIGAQMLVMALLASRPDSTAPARARASPATCARTCSGTSRRSRSPTSTASPPPAWSPA